jgi:hypothetical protein
MSVGAPSFFAVTGYAELIRFLSMQKWVSGPFVGRLETLT